jgi:hypothetical protein
MKANKKEGKENVGKNEKENNRNQTAGYTPRSWNRVVEK